MGVGETTGAPTEGGAATAEGDGRFFTAGKLAPMPIRKLPEAPAGGASASARR